MAYAEPNVAVFPTLHMPVHREGGWQHKYSVHKCTHTHSCTFTDKLSLSHTHADAHTHTHKPAVLISEVGVL